MAKRSESYVVELGQRLMRAKIECKRLQAEWDALFSPQQTSDKEPPPGRSENTVVSRIIAYLNTESGRAFDKEQIMAALNLSNPTSTASTLSKLVKRGKIRKYGNDRYTSLQPLPEEVFTISTGEEHEKPDKEVVWSER